MNTKNPSLRVTSVAVLTAVFTTAIGPTASGSGQWPQFRGPNGTGVAPDDAPAPIRFGLQENVLWKTALPPGHSSPCIWDDRIFLTAFDAGTGGLATLCLDRASGAILWRRLAPRVELDPALHRSNGPASSTPATDGHRVYAYFGSYGMLAYDFEGTEVWKRRLPVPPTREGNASSPIVHREALWLQRDGNSADSHLLVLETDTGDIKWTIQRPLHGTSYSTPMIWSEGGMELLVTIGAGRVDAYDVVDGKQRWWMAGLTFNPIGVAVAGNGLLFASAAGTGTRNNPIPFPSWEQLLDQFDLNHDGGLSESEIPEDEAIQLRAEVPKETPGNVLGYRQIFLGLFDADKDGLFTRQEWDAFQKFLAHNRDHVMAIQPGGAGDITDTQLKWKGTVGISEIPSPLYYRGRLYFVRDGGMFTCYDAKSGTVLIDRERLGVIGQYAASPVAGGGRIYAASLSGKVVVVKASVPFEVLAVNDLEEAITATPAILEGRLYVRTAGQFYAFGNGELR